MNRALRFLKRYAFAWAIVCGLPLIAALVFFRFDFVRDVSAVNTSIASSIALFIGLYITSKLSAFPGTRRGKQVTPAMLAGYSVVIATLLVFRIPYSVGFLVYSITSSIALTAVFTNLFISAPRNNFYVVPSRRGLGLADLEGVALFRMEEPDLPSDPRASIVVDLRSNLTPEWERMLAVAALRGIPVYHFKFLHESIAGKVKVEHLSENTFGSLVPDQVYFEIKMFADRVFAFFLLPFLLPLFAIVAAGIKFQDGGEIFYCQKRIGRGGRPFTIYKFRSMRSADGERHADNCQNAAVTTEGDPRITRLGAVIRRYRVDELPQIINILRGEMSFIGPRPEAISLAEWYEEELPFYSYRHIVLPGLTGWAQVNQGHVTDLSDADHKLQYDFYYIKYFSAWLDVLIVLKTIKTIFSGFGSK